MHGCIRRPGGELEGPEAGVGGSSITTRGRASRAGAVPASGREMYSFRCVRVHVYSRSGWNEIGREENRRGRME